jgi:hypothetical protein
MKSNRIMPLLVLALLMLAGMTALAEDNCSVWMKQTDGTYWRTCVEDNGHQYCQTADSNGKNVTRVACK